MPPPYSNNRAHALRHFLTIAGPNSRRHSKGGEEGVRTSRSEDKENFFLVSPMVRVLRLRSVSRDRGINSRWGPKSKRFFRVANISREKCQWKVVERNSGLKFRIL